MSKAQLFIHTRIRHIITHLAIAKPVMLAQESRGFATTALRRIGKIHVQDN